MWIFEFSILCRHVQAIFQKVNSKEIPVDQSVDEHEFNPTNQQPDEVVSVEDLKSQVVELQNSVSKQERFIKAKDNALNKKNKTIQELTITNAIFEAAKTRNADPTKENVAVDDNTSNADTNKQLVVVPRQEDVPGDITKIYTQVQKHLTNVVKTHGLWVSVLAPFVYFCLFSFFNSSGWAFFVLIRLLFAILPGMPTSDRSAIRENVENIRAVAKKKLKGSIKVVYEFTGFHAAIAFALGLLVLVFKYLPSVVACFLLFMFIESGLWSFLVSGGDSNQLSPNTIKLDDNKKGK